MVLCHFADTTDTTVAKVVDIVHFAFTVTNRDQLFHHFDDVNFVQRALLFRIFTTD
ncbi:Uncharacterised protein [Vibrio cholerae]|nr:Uncharacterised protein [Vibrio cholerae]CSD23169.1 Uncharacterised protein [Vibrio cholerae]CSD30410.1 Uncharacterised protein [Vibrio cholerae]CSI23764.1 Uncharacterised protein [Vibrio cholerae]CSI45613.1 Uncharacterised protein [Vibrio cholerae]